MSAKNSKKPVLPTSMKEAYVDFHYAPGTASGGFLFIAGQIGLDENGEAPADPRQQAHLAFQAMGEVLGEAGLDFGDLVSITSHHVGGIESVLDWFSEVKDEYIREPYPCWTVLGVTGLAIPGLVVEIAGIARLRDS